jgi:hypothetical protein
MRTLSHRNVTCSRHDIAEIYSLARGGSRWGGGGGGGGGGAHPARAPLKLEKNMIFWRKIVIFHTKYPKYFRTFLRNWKKYDFLA